ncbi:MAG: TraR/DksA family transcriptional regulator [Brachymonas sp.]
MRTRLNASQLAELQAVLLQRKADIEQRLQQVHDGQTRAEHARTVLLQDGDDAPQRSSDREVDLALSDMGTVDLARIQAALDRMAAGVYGICEECGEEIDFARLQLEPQTAHCVNCKARWEKETGKAVSHRM